MSFWRFQTCTKNPRSEPRSRRLNLQMFWQRVFCCAITSRFWYSSIAPNSAAAAAPLRDGADQIVHVDARLFALSQFSPARILEALPPSSLRGNLARTREGRREARLSRRYSGSFKSNLASHASPRAHVRRIEPSSLDRFSPIDRYCSRLETAPSLFRRKPVLLARLLVIARSIAVVWPLSRSLPRRRKRAGRGPSASRRSLDRALFRQFKFLV